MATGVYLLRKPPCWLRRMINCGPNGKTWTSVQNLWSYHLEPLPLLFTMRPYWLSHFSVNLTSDMYNVKVQPQDLSNSISLPSDKKKPVKKSPSMKIDMSMFGGVYRRTAYVVWNISFGTCTFSRTTYVSMLPHHVSFRRKQLTRRSQGDFRWARKS